MTSSVFSEQNEQTSNNINTTTTITTSNLYNLSNTTTFVSMNPAFSSNADFLEQINSNRMDTNNNDLDDIVDSTDELEDMDDFDMENNYKSKSSSGNPNNNGDSRTGSGIGENGGGPILEDDKKKRRAIANSNERRRMQSINAGFQTLKTLIPHSSGEKLSKACILQRSADYMKYLSKEKEKLTLNLQLALKLIESNNLMSQFQSQQINLDISNMTHDSSASSSSSNKQSYNNKINKHLIESTNTNIIVNEPSVNSLSNTAIIESVPSTLAISSTPPKCANIITKRKSISLISSPPHQLSIQSFANLTNETSSNISSQFSKSPSSSKKKLDQHQPPNTDVSITHQLSTITPLVLPSSSTLNQNRQLTDTTNLNSYSNSDSIISSSNVSAQNQTSFTQPSLLIGNQPIQLISSTDPNNHSQKKLNDFLDQHHGLIQLQPAQQNATQTTTVTPIDSIDLIKLLQQSSTNQTTPVSIATSSGILNINGMDIRLLNNGNVIDATAIQNVITSGSSNDLQLLQSILIDNAIKEASVSAQQKHKPTTATNTNQQSHVISTSPAIPIINSSQKPATINQQMSGSDTDDGDNEEEEDIGDDDDDMIISGGDCLENISRLKTSNHNNLDIKTPMMQARHVHKKIPLNKIKHMHQVSATVVSTVNKSGRSNSIDQLIAAAGCIVGNNGAVATSPSSSSTCSSSSSSSVAQFIGAEKLSLVENGPTVLTSTIHNSSSQITVSNPILIIENSSNGMIQQLSNAASACSSNEASNSRKMNLNTIVEAIRHVEGQDGESNTIANTLGNYPVDEFAEMHLKIQQIQQQQQQQHIPSSSYDASSSGTSSSSGSMASPNKLNGQAQQPKPPKKRKYTTEDISQLGHGHGHVIASLGGGHVISDQNQQTVIGNGGLCYAIELGQLGTNFQIMNNNSKTEFQSTSVPLLITSSSTLPVNNAGVVAITTNNLHQNNSSGSVTSSA